MSDRDVNDFVVCDACHTEPAIKLCRGDRFMSYRCENCLVPGLATEDLRQTKRVYLWLAQTRLHRP
jgi:hypothetical protein